MRVILLGAGAWLAFAVLVDGYLRSVEEVAPCLREHSKVACPNWHLGIATGVFVTGLFWWFCSSRRPS